MLSAGVSGLCTAAKMDELTQESDETLLRRCSRGDERAFTMLYRRRQGGVYRFALHMSGRNDVAEEVTQEVFLTLIREPGRFDASKGTVVSFLYGIARNHVLRQIERGRREVAVDHASFTEAPADDADVFGRMAREEAIEAVRQAVLTLPAVYRETVVLCELEEMQYTDAASVLGVPVGTVRSRLNRGRGMLLEKLRGRNVARCSA
jgi:RNA polymerase sigma-70 factor (ECF subfamily)